MKYTAVAILVLSVWSSASGQPFGDPGPADLPGVAAGSPARNYFRVRAVASHTEVTAGQKFHVSLVGELADGWVYYSPHPGPIVPTASLDVAAGKFIVGEALWPADESKAEDYGDGPVLNFFYKKKFVIHVPLAVPEDMSAGEYRVTLSLAGQICGNQCINFAGFGAISAFTSVTVGAASVANPQWSGEIAGSLGSAMPVGQLKATRSPPGTPPRHRPSPVSSEVGALGFWGGLGLALLAGLTLNIMPCVLPIIPLRILSLVQMAGESRRRFVTLGLAFAGGIVLFFVALGAVNVVLKQFGSATLDINEHFKYPAVRIGIAMLLLALAANLFGLFNVILPAKLAGMGQERKASGHLSAAGMGLMMAVLATPCSFWLMALSLAWAQLQPMWLGTLGIVLIGVGMAAPHAVLASFPDLLRKLPAPGAWMELFKQTMGFLLLPAVLYLLGTLTEGVSWPIRAAGFGVVLTFSLWVWGKWVRYDAPLKRKLFVRGPAVALVVAAGLWLLPKPAPPLVKFEAFDRARLAEARAEGKIVVVKVTAGWCTSCKLLDLDVFNTPPVAKEFADRGVVAIKADVTDSGSSAAEWVRKNFRTSPPLTIIYPADGGEPFTKVGGFEISDLIRWLDEARGRTRRRNELEPAARKR